MESLNQISSCEVCGNTNLVPVLNLGNHPLCDDLIPLGNSHHCMTFPIDIVYCRQCDTAHQRYQVPKNQLFPQSYHYRSRFTADVLSGMTALVDSVESQTGSLTGLTVLDIGCNDGSLLDKFSDKGAKTIGVEPTGAFEDAEGRNHLIINDFFTEATAQDILNQNDHIDIITFTNVFAHIEDLQSLLKALRLVMNDNTSLVIENHYLGAVLARNQFDTFYHEHPRTYSLNSFVHIARTLNCHVSAVEFPKRYGGNIRVIISKATSSNPEVALLIQQTLKREAGFFNDFGVIRTFISEWKHRKKAEIQTLVKDHGRLIAKAFPGRAAILVALLELSEIEIECVFEKPGSLKIGHYLPGTRIPILSDTDMFPRFKDTNILLNLAWHIPDEIESYMRKNGYTGKLVNVL